MQEFDTVRAHSVEQRQASREETDNGNELAAASRPELRALSTPDLLALILGARGSQTPAVEASRCVLGASAYSLRELARTPLDRLAALPAVGPARAAAIVAAFELGRRLRAEAFPLGTPIRSPWQVAALVAPWLEDLPVQECHVVLLGPRLQLERVAFLTRGTLSATIIHPRDVFREALTSRAASVVVVHNHPCGDPTPTPEDRAVTADLVAGGRLLGIPVLDHVIIGHGRYVSFAESGLLTPSVATAPAPRGRHVAEDRWRHVVRERPRRGRRIGPRRLARYRDG